MAFDNLKQAFTSGQIFIHVDLEKLFIMEATEINHEIHDKELLAIVESLEEWH